VFDISSVKSRLTLISLDKWGGGALNGGIIVEVEVTIMSATWSEQRILAQLRLDAETQLREGKPPPPVHTPPSADALALLHDLATNPDSATNALKLLHELQVYQIELDLQHQQMVENELELSSKASRYKTLFDFAPVGYFTLDPDGTILEANLAGTELLGAASESVIAVSIRELLAPQSQPKVAELLQALREGDAVAYCDAQPLSGDAVARHIQITMKASPDHDTVLMTITGYNTPSIVD